MCTTHLLKSCHLTFCSLFSHVVSTCLSWRKITSNAWRCRASNSVADFYAKFRFDVLARIRFASRESYLHFFFLALIPKSSHLSPTEPALVFEGPNFWQLASASAYCVIRFNAPFIGLSCVSQLNFLVNEPLSS